MNPEVSLESLVQNQRSLFKRIAKAYENLKKIGSSNYTIGIVDSRLQALEQNWRKFEAQHELMGMQHPELLRTSAYTTEDVFDKAEEAYLTQKGQFLDVLARLNPPNVSAGVEVAGTSVKSESRTSSFLPRIQIPHFSGKYEDWASFRDLFTSLIRKDSSLSNVEKLHYLKASIKGEAEALLKNITITNDNLTLAWETLQNAYENKRLIVRAHLNAVTTLPAMTMESPEELKRILHTVTGSVGGLEAIGRPIHSNSDLLVHLIAERLDKKSRRDWEESISGSSEPPSYDELKNFLENRLRTLEAVNPTKGERNASKTSSNTRYGLTNARSHLIEKQRNAKGRCPLCPRDHFILFCGEYQSKQPVARKELIAKFRLCSNCLGRHPLAECRSSKTCSRCSEKHHTSIHDAVVLSPSEASTSRSALTSRREDIGSETILLATALVKVADCDGNHHLVRALIDPGSEVSIASESLVQRLRLVRHSTSVSIVGIGAQSSCGSRGRVVLDITSRVNTNFNLKVSALILPRLTSYGAKCRDLTTLWPHVKGLTLADPQFYSNEAVELLLGADVYGSIVEEGLRRGTPRTPIAQKTAFGWILSGVVDKHGTESPVSSLQVSVDKELTSIVKLFWEQEEFPRSERFLTPEEQECEEHFVHTHFRLQDGRYVVRLPIRSELPNLLATRHSAERMLNTMERRFIKDDSFASLYREFLEEYENLNHMAQTTKTGSRICYLPHHGVLKASSTTTKLRVVFNGSQVLHTGESLNDFLLAGPKLLPDLSDIILRWRLHTFVLTADIEKMYRQIRIHTADQDLQRILWRKHSNEEIKEYRLKTVTYGLTCAPFLAIRTLHQLACDEESKFPKAATVLRRDVYVDDILTGASTIEEALELQHQLMELCMAGGFPLRKWAANSEKLLVHLPAEDVAIDVALSWDTDTSHTALGLKWHPQADCFSFTFNLERRTGPLTRRRVLSELAQLFDPLGWLSPVTITAKIFVQSLWLQHLEWDTPLKSRDVHYWQNLYDDLPILQELRVPRFIGGNKLIDLHGFSDASERAYAAVIYLRVRDHQGEISTSLFLAKTKVAPLKQISVPRLELTAATLLVRLTAHALSLLPESDLEVHLWSDSTVTLGWLEGHPSKWTTFVANRVSEVQRTLPDGQWHHVPSGENPADCASRGLLPHELQGHPLWWHGPPWMRKASEDWPSKFTLTNHDELPEQRRTALTLQSTTEEAGSVLHRFSSLTFLLRVTARCLRWITVTQHRRASSSEHVSPSFPSFITTAELRHAEQVWIRQVQKTFFTDEITSLKKGGSISPRSPLLRLNPFLDTYGTLRVGGRLKHSLLGYDEKHPVILPHSSHFTTLLIRHSHSQSLHGGTQLTLSSLRRRFWILNGRRAVRRCIHRCVTCIRWRATTRTQQMGDLPERRVMPSRPFLHTGLDYAGPIHLRTSKGRGQKSYKGYIVIFICTSTKAVHIELVSDYTAEAFLAAYRRFISRRGLCRTLSSDCGTNLIGAETQLRHLLAAASREFHIVANQLASDGVEWKFNPPSAPHFGGLWEAAVKSVKFHLKRVIGEAKLTFEEMYTLLTQVEACLNSRPLQAMTDDAEDLVPMTPGHFLIGSSLKALPEPSFGDSSSTNLSRWKLLQQMRTTFWRRWSQEYLHTLQSRTKWWRKGPEIKTGDLCLIKNELYPPSRWPLARVIKLHPGQDGLTRVVTLRTANGEIKRPIVKIVPLPGPSYDSSSKNPESDL